MVGIYTYGFSLLIMINLKYIVLALQMRLRKVGQLPPWLLANTWWEQEANPGWFAFKANVVHTAEHLLQLSLWSKPTSGYMAGNTYSLCKGGFK